MDTFVSSKELQKLIKTKDGDAVQDEADVQVPNGYDCDGSTGLEIFENGFELGKRAESRGKQVYHFELGNGTSIFFIGTEKEVKERIEALPDHDDVDDEEDEQDEEDEEDD